MTSLYFNPIIDGHAQSRPKLRGRTSTEWFGDNSLAALADAAATGDTAEVERLVKSGTSVDGLSIRDRITPLFFSFGANNYAGSRKLLELGADPNIDTEIDRAKGRMVILLAMSKMPRLLELILEFKADPSYVEAGRTPLIHAIGNLENIRLLIKYGADVNWDDGFRTTAASYAAGLLELETVKLLLEAGASKELDHVALALQLRQAPPRLEPQRRELLDMLRARGAKIHYSSRNPDTPNVTHPELTPEQVKARNEEAARRRRERGVQ